MGAGSLLLSRVGLFSGEADFFWSDCQSGVRFLWGFIGTGLAGNEKSCTFALAKPRGVRSYGAPAEVGASGSRKKNFSDRLQE